MGAGGQPDGDTADVEDHHGAGVLVDATARKVARARGHGQRARVRKVGAQSVELGDGRRGVGRFQSVAQLGGAQTSGGVVLAQVRGRAFAVAVGGAELLQITHVETVSPRLPPRAAGDWRPIYSGGVSVPDTSVTIIGASGALGFGLAVRLAAAGVEVTIGSREHARAQEAAERVLSAAPGCRVNGLTNAQAAAANELLILSVPFASHGETLAHIGETMSPGQLLIDATVPLAGAVGGRATRMLGVWQGSAAQQAQELVPEGVSVVAALHTVGAAALRDLEHQLDEDVLIVGDRRAEKARAAALIGRIEGLRCLDAGRLEMARITESLTALLISVNGRYKTHAGIRLTGLPDTLW
jgi:8-hydroxy-5-deazaflavin:NADPH oxidoreductase